ncbi:uncharacterized protein LOC114282647 [Camellia sinensis]|uniref:uncharacterized protein LOC114282647 n=1 Tax=Camellia sinensis TaxID=4442 RepID=UPI001036489A|nr:uncharacterized protein LOC114282647 [Camellia sinensis]
MKKNPPPWSPEHTLAVQKIKAKVQQLPCLNLPEPEWKKIRDYYQNLSADANILYTRLKKNPPPWSPEHTLAVQKIKAKVQQLPCLNLPNPEWKKIVEIDASNEGFGGILKQFNPKTQKEELLRFHSGHWNQAALNYPTIKQECLAIVKCVMKFQDDLLNQHFIIRVDCSAARQIFKQDVKNLVSKQIFVSWQGFRSTLFYGSHSFCFIVTINV